MTGDKAIEAARKKSGFVEVIKERCKSCELCVGICPRECLRISEEMNSSGYFVVEFVNEDNCTACQMCSDMCPDMALKVWK